MNTKGDIKVYDGRKRVKDFIAIYRDGKLQRVKNMNDETFGDEGNLSGYILPRSFDRLEDVHIDQCSRCDQYFPDGLNECEHCGDQLCCDCADEHRDEITDEIDTGGCRY